MKKNERKIKDLHEPDAKRSFLLAIKLGAANFWRNKFLSIATIIVMAVILFIFNIIITIQFVANQALQTLSQRVDVVVYLRDDVNSSEVAQLINNLQTVKGVSKVKYTSKEEALEIVSKTHPKTAELLKKFNLTNPLPPSISIVTQKPEDQTYVQAFLSKSEYKDFVQNFTSEAGSTQGQILSSVTQNLNALSQFVRQIVFWMIFVFVLGGTLIIANAIQLTIYMRRQEISIMKLVGATPAFLRIPFIFEAALYGICSVVLSFTILAFLGSQIQLEESGLWTLGSHMPFENIFMGELGITLVLAIITSWTAVRQHIQKKI